ncbi:MAG TPA: N-formylglutamate deformylase [Xanthomonadales bacterium]|nr:N-formylglutamate deformylase [Xanthomonadales bacterium]
MNEQLSKIEVHQGRSPLVVSVPHAGTLIPASIHERLNPEVHDLPDTDWYVDRLFDFAPDSGASMIKTCWSRYVIDLNRPSDNAPLYANQSGSSLVPLETFTGEKIYREGEVPDSREVDERIELYWRPYHARLSALVDNALERHGFAILLDGHSIRSELPDLFDGELPNLNIGSASGSSAAASLVELVCSHLQHPGMTLVRDKRFKGGFITRQYGQPGENVHAVQLEIAQRTYMQEFPPVWDENMASGLVGMLKGLVSGLHQWRPENQQ